MRPFFCASSKALSKDCKSVTYPLSKGSSSYVLVVFTPPFPRMTIWSEIRRQYSLSERESIARALTLSRTFPSILKNLSSAPLSIILDKANNIILKSLLIVALSLNFLRNDSNSLSSFSSKQIEYMQTLSLCSMVFNFTFLSIIYLFYEAKISVILQKYSLISEILRIIIIFF